jgi:RNA polymerase sigma-70 factor (ECF subfamily)
MSADPLDALLEQLCQGDAEAAEHVFLAYEPYLRMVVRRMLPASLHSKFDSVDVVQSVWADLLQGFRDSGWRFRDTAHLRAFLIKVTKNRFLNKIREHGAAGRHEQALEESELAGLTPTRDPSPSAEAQAAELWEQLLALCPPQHRELLRLKRDGHSLDEIAASSGLHPSSVRRILYDLARQFALKGAAPPE